MKLKEWFGKFIEAIHTKTSSYCPKCLEIFGIVEKVIMLDELSEEEWEEIKRLLDELDD